jgi:hypothetical protein
MLKPELRNFQLAILNRDIEQRILNQSLVDFWVILAGELETIMVM